MKRSSCIEWEINSNIEAVWKVVTDLGDCSWRSDLAKIEKISETEFIEYFATGGSTNFLIASKKFCDTYTFDMENKFFNGKWTGKFIKINDQKTKLVFSEALDIKNPFIWFASFFVMNLKKSQKVYMEDLEKRLIVAN